MPLSSSTLIICKQFSAFSGSAASLRYSAKHCRASWRIFCLKRREKTTLGSTRSSVSRISKLQHIDSLWACLNNFSKKLVFVCSCSNAAPRTALSNVRHPISILSSLSKYAWWRLILFLCGSTDKKNSMRSWMYCLAPSPSRLSAPKNTSWVMSSIARVGCVYFWS